MVESQRRARNLERCACADSCRDSSAVSSVELDVAIERKMAQHAGRVVGRAAPQWMRRAAFELTDSAAERLRNLLAQKQPPPLGVRVSLRNRGCNGMSYTLKYVTDSQEDRQKTKLDEQVCDKGVRVFIDPRALLNVAGTEMDFIDTELSSEFVFRNPNVKGTCGCGESFSVK